MKTVVLGARGQMGQDLVARLGPSVIPLTRREADLTDPNTLRAALTAHRPTVVINCAAYNQVDRAETEPEAVFRVNAWAVRDLALICRDLDATLVHFSTDYVFGLDEGRTTPWTEADAPGPVSVYGLSKLAGEYLIRSLCPGHLVIRTCGLYGLHGVGGKGTNFVETMLRLGGQGKPLRVVADQVCSPSWTHDVANTTAALLDRGARGLVHVVNAGSCSWYELARATFELSNLAVEITPITTVEYAAPARRPAYSALSVDALARLGVPAPPPWREALQGYLSRRKDQREGP